LSKARATLEQSYGKIPSQEYLAAMRKIDETPMPRDTLREDYEIGIRENSLVIEYFASCGACKFSHTFKSDVRVYPPAAK
jgi:hypothetical protein